MIPGERLIVNDARALRQRLVVLGSAAEWAKENLFRLHEQREKVPLEYEILAPKLVFRDVSDEERKRFGSVHDLWLFGGADCSGRCV